MPKLVKDNALADCGRAFLAKDATLDSITRSNDVVPLSLWLEHLDQCKARGIDAVWVDSDELTEPLAPSLEELSLVAIHFPTFMDGRGFSTGRILRERLGFTGEIRAFGNVIQDQMHYLLRCGFNAFALREGTDLESALISLQDFTEHYQAAVVQDKPLFLRRSA
ncbi:DUF934 domain-containing protein [Simiduia agarivorans]|uniref:Oxidoreductase probably involved in sulfite reduction n=1 Tax=Simiduia agarivorans (strain DSM 21679 / JCM 13881 / BCRC 17597 / SA1) TaxID=1117647 RepID=K4KHK1_SIMAS|nr:DUF934 domain-containing protein [Simiduia agarivorans]AFU97645.1 hypothetical protein M5M_02130 [Simiduia agarivorans SA1 = DSM 21679]